MFSAGDMRRGQSLVVWAIREGRLCARAIDQFLMGIDDAAAVSAYRVMCVGARTRQSLARYDWNGSSERAAACFAAKLRARRSSS